MSEDLHRNGELEVNRLYLARTRGRSASCKTRCDPNIHAYYGMGCPAGNAQTGTDAVQCLCETQAQRDAVQTSTLGIRPSYECLGECASGSTSPKCKGGRTEAGVRVVCEELGNVLGSISTVCASIHGVGGHLALHIVP